MTCECCEAKPPYTGSYDTKCIKCSARLIAALGSSFEKRQAINMNTRFDRQTLIDEVAKVIDGNIKK